MRNTGRSGLDEIDDARRKAQAAFETEAPGAEVVNGPRAGAATEFSAKNAPARRLKSLESRPAGLASAIRKARLDSADRADALTDLRVAEIGRLELLREQLAPILAQIPRDCDLFDVAIAPTERPRLFIDALGFVELAGDRRRYRFAQDTRHGRVTIAETDQIDAIIESVTAYIAHRLVEREKALAVDYASASAASATAARAAAQVLAASATPPRGAQMSPKSVKALLFFAEFMASAVFFALVALIGLWVYRSFH